MSVVLKSLLVVFNDKVVMLYYDAINEYRYNFVGVHTNFPFHSLSLTNTLSLAIKLLPLWVENNLYLFPETYGTLLPRRGKNGTTLSFPWL